MAGVNKVILVGRVGADPEVKTFDSGDKLVRFSLATSEKYKDKEGNPQEITEWHNIVVRREGLVGVVQQYVRKGSQIYVDGKLRTRSWDDQSGGKRYTTEVIMETLQLLGSAPGQSTSAPSSEASPSRGSEASQPPIGDIDDDLPF
jgi:single-strand DNA-binding protein